MPTVTQYEHERAGIALPAPLVMAAQRKLEDHLADFQADLRAKGRAHGYVRHVGERTRRLLTECAWVLPKDVSSDSFVTWRSRVADVQGRRVDFHALRHTLATRWPGPACRGSWRCWSCGTATPA